MNVGDLAARVSAHLRAHRSLLMRESGIHDAIAAALFDADLLFDRELRLSGRDRVDFFLRESRTAIEVKKGAAGLQVFRQVARYLSHQRVSACIVIAPRITPVLPSEAMGKPIARVELWRYML